MEIINPVNETGRDLTGLRVGKLVVVGKSGRSADNHVTWKCLCDCGKTKLTQGRYLRVGKPKSCGCFTGQLIGAATRTHGQRYTAEWKSWAAMKYRCTNKNNLSYYRYGGRGINVCERWINSFENFIADLGQCPKGMTLERIDNDGHYSPSNCRWATRKEQISNRSNSVGVDLRAIAAERGIGYKYAWSLHKAGRI